MRNSSINAGIFTATLHFQRVYSLLPIHQPSPTIHHGSSSQGAKSFFSARMSGESGQLSKLQPPCGNHLPTIGWSNIVQDLTYHIDDSMSVYEQNYENKIVHLILPRSYVFLFLLTCHNRDPPVILYCQWTIPTFPRKYGVVNCWSKPGWVIPWTGSVMDYLTSHLQWIYNGFRWIYIILTSLKSSDSTIPQNRLVCSHVHPCSSMELHLFGGKRVNPPFSDQPILPLFCSLETWRLSATARFSCTNSPGKSRPHLLSSDFKSYQGCGWRMFKSFQSRLSLGLWSFQISNIQILGSSWKPLMQFRCVFHGQF